MAKQFDIRKAQHLQEAKNAGKGLQLLIKNSGARFHVQRGNRVWNSLARGMAFPRGY